MKRIQVLHIAFVCLLLLPGLQSFAQGYPRHWMIGIGTNMGNYKQLSHWGQKEADVIDHPAAGLNLKLNHFWGVNEYFYLGSGVDLIMMHHSFRPTYEMEDKEIFDRRKVRTAQYGAELPVYFKWHILRQPKPYDFAVSLGHKFSYFYGNPSSREITAENGYSFTFDQNYQAIDDFKFGLNYALFAEFFLIKKRKNGKDFAISLNYTHYFEHAAFGKYQFFDKENRMLAIGQIQGYCNYVIVNFCYKFDRIKEELMQFQ